MSIMTEERTKKSIKILVVEDSRTQAEFLRYILEEEGCRVMLAEDGREALGEINSYKPDIVLTDIVMPEIDGYELCRRIKSDDNTKDIPVILVTQLYDPADVIKGLESGADNFIIKPYEQSDIQKWITNILPSLHNPDPDGQQKALSIRHSDKDYLINAGRTQILNILLSTYGVAVRKNSELEEAQERLNSLNEQLKEAVFDLKDANEELISENTERKRVENALAEANKKLQLMASITRHDILNQLTAMQGYIEIAMTLKDEEPDSAWENIDKAFSMIDKTKNTIEFTGDYQEIGMHTPIWQDMHTLVMNSLKHTQTGNIRFENIIPEGVEIYADSMIEKVFSNLIENAVRYGDKITYIRFRTESFGDKFKVICEDDGVGIRERDKEKIFSYEYGMNTGFGLFLSREILGITGIKIRETGKSGEGARFELICPEDAVRNFGEE
ncbi:response regulator receiver sensor signal transduction histidine kinase [Methanoplanus limicola DSM 2279]|uniref:Response regulator receiver sensor signal transduction histidine kinase n=2 Tax=Methanoplanus limicola TaxID=2315 RepID=H1YZJ2_9EURY|nr:response regulator receiver sensor signal transduction histidine kinase [Methanoplanus limicola DSM 2279]